MLFNFRLKNVLLVLVLSILVNKILNKDKNKYYFVLKIKNTWVNQGEDIATFLQMKDSELLIELKEQNTPCY